MKLPSTPLDDIRYNLMVCSKSPSYFAQNFIFSKPLSDDQITWLESGQSLGLGSDRQTRRTSTMLARALWSFVFKPEYKILYLTPKLQLAQSARQEFQHMYRQLPTWMSVPLHCDNRDQMENNCGSTISFKTAIQGQRMDLLLLDNTSIMSQVDYNELMCNVRSVINLSSGIMLKAK